METAALAQTILQNIETGKTTIPVVEAQMAQMEEALNQGRQIIGLTGTPDEAREVIRLVRAGLAPAPEAVVIAGTLEEVEGVEPVEEEEVGPVEEEEVGPVAIESAASLTLHHTPTDALLDALDHTMLARVTTQHAASSYGQPVVLLEDGSLVDYAAIAALHLLGSPASVAQAVAQALAPFGIRVTRQPVEEEPGRRFPTIAAALVWVQREGIPDRAGWQGVDAEHLATWLWREAVSTEHPADLLPRYWREYRA